MHAGLGNLLILVVPLLLLVWLVMSQRRRQQQVASLQASINPGDRVVTTSGLFGTIKATEGGVVSLEIADGVVVHWDRRGIASRVESPTVDTADGTAGPGSTSVGED